MRCINKTVLLQQLSACPSNEISENRMHFWISMFGHEVVVHPNPENEENSAFKEEILEENKEGENTNEETN